MFVLIVILLTLIFLLAITYLCVRPYVKTNRGLPSPRPIYPIFGHQITLLRYGFQVCHTRWLEKLFGTDDRTNKSRMSYGSLKIFSICDGLNPSIVIADPRVLKLVLIKDFSSFPDRKLLILHQKCVTKSIIAQNYDDGWKLNRHILIRSFTTSMQKRMLGTTLNCTKDFLLRAAPNFKLNQNAGNLVLDGRTPFEAKAVFGKYAIDLIMRNAFGMDLKPGSMEEAMLHEHANTIFCYGMYRFATLSWLRPVVNLVSTLFGISLVGENSLIYIGNVISSLYKSRTREGLLRKDLYQIMNDAALASDNQSGFQAKNICPFAPNSWFTHKSTKYHDPSDVFDHENVQANSIFVVLATYDTLSTALSWLTYHLATNPDKQELIYAELMTNMENGYTTKYTNETGYIRSTDGVKAQANSEIGTAQNELLAEESKNNGKNLTEFNKSTTHDDDSSKNYEFLGNLPFMDAFIKESLRHDPPLAIINRVATKDYVLFHDTENDVVDGCPAPSRIKSISADLGTCKEVLIKKGTLIDIPIYAIHHDPSNWQNPEDFDPTRFLKGYDKYAYLPFGIGPRNCVAEKYAMLTLKAFLAVTLPKVIFKTCDRTLLNISPHTTRFKLNEFHYPTAGIWLVAEPRMPS